jgi:ligand-binding SRPBCC domain-containing protein
MRFAYQTEQRLPYPVEQVFEFFANPENLPLLMPAGQKARIDHASIVPPPPRAGLPSGWTVKAAGTGSRLTLSFRPFPFSPVRLSWQAEISEFVWDEHFCDRQLSGPFAFWSHCHYVRPITHLGSEGTLIADDLEYELPFGTVGQLAHRLFLRRQIERTFAFRQSQLARLLDRTTSRSQPQQAP